MKLAIRALRDPDTLQAQPAAPAVAVPDEISEPPRLSTDAMNALRDFHRTIIMDGFHKIDKLMIQRLTQSGALESMGFGKHRLTEYGEWLLAAPVAAQAQPQRLLFPTYLRKMWSGGEVQAWLDEQLDMDAPTPSAKGSLKRYRQWQADQAQVQHMAEDALEIIRMMSTGEWNVVRNLHDKCLTDEANSLMAWQVERRVPPFCSIDNSRIWFGTTAIEACRKGRAAIGAARTALGGDQC